MTQTYLSPAEAAEYLRLSRQTIYNMIGERKITSSRIGRRTLIAKDELDRIIAKGQKGRTAIKRSPRCL